MKITHIKYQIRTIGVEGTEGTYSPNDKGGSGRARTGVVMLELFNGDRCIYWTIIAEDKTKCSKSRHYRRLGYWLVDNGFMDISRLSPTYRQEYLNQKR